MYAPIAFIAPQYENYANWYLKGYAQGTTTPLSMATDSTGGTLLAKAEIDTQGFITTDGTARFIPHFNAAYDLFLFPTEEEADADITANVIEVADNINPAAAPSEDFVPAATDQYDLGTTALKWQELHLNGNAAIGGVTTVGGNILSDTDSTDDLGTTGVRFANLYVDDVTATTSVTVGGDPVVSARTEVADYQRAGNTQLLTMETVPSSKTISAGGAPTAAATWTSVGPTGSGADIIWTAMDVLPSEARSLEVTAELQVRGSGSGSTGISIYGAMGGITPAVLAANTRYLGILIEAVALDYVTTYGTFWVPLSDTQVFQTAYLVANSNTTGESVVLWIRGFETD